MRGGSTCYADHSQRLTAFTGRARRIVGEKTARRDDELPILRHTETVWTRLWRVVYCRDPDAHRGNVGIAGAVVRPIGEEVTAVEIDGRSIPEGSV